MRKRAFTGAASMAAIGWLCAAPPSFGAADVTYPSSSTTIPANSPAAALVACPAGRHAIGGGVHITGSSLEVEVITTTPIDRGDADSKPDDGWFAGGNAGPSPETITAYGICARGDFDYAAARKTVKPGKNGRTTATCPQGTKAISGGVDVPIVASTLVTLTTSTPSGERAWLGRIFNGSASKVKLKTWAVCLKHANTVTNGISNGVPVFLDNTQDTLTTPSCSDTTHTLTGIGGTVLDPSSGTEIASLEPTDLDADIDPDDGATAYFNNQSGAGQRMSVTDICTKL